MYIVHVLYNYGLTNIPSASNLVT